MFGCSPRSNKAHGDSGGSRWDAPCPKYESSGDISEGSTVCVGTSLSCHGVNKRYARM